MLQNSEAAQQSFFLTHASRGQLVWAEFSWVWLKLQILTFLGPVGRLGYVLMMMAEARKVQLDKHS